MSKLATISLCVFALALPVLAGSEVSLRPPNTVSTIIVSPSDPATYGTADETSVQIAFHDFTQFASDAVFKQDGIWGGYVKTAAVGFIPGMGAPLHVPNGVLITGIEIQGCDSSSTAELQIWPVIRDDPGSSNFFTPVISTGVAATPGCGHFRTSFAPVQVDNATHIYNIGAIFNGSPLDGTVTVSGVRVFYKLQVSPGPAVATFSDVPTGSGIYKFVEALYASGITAGCGGGNYCPNQAITRGQMAVFLASALGLHFPN